MEQFRIDRFVEDAGKGRLSEVEDAVALGIDVNAKSSRRGDSALHYAVTSRQEEVVKVRSL